MARTFSLIFTGMSGSGKTTLADIVNQRLKKLGVPVQYIDGDEFRKTIGNLFGYTRAERMKNNQVVRTVVKYLNANGINVIFTLVAPYEEMRQEMRKQIGDAYIEVFAKCSSEECSRRDVKGHYKKQQEGKMANLNGIDDVFEEPENSDIVVDTEQESIEECVGKIMDYLRKNNCIDYKYITENNLEHRQNYMYSAYGGEAFVYAYKATRESFIKEYENEIPNEIEFDKSGVMSRTYERLMKLVTEISSGGWNESVKKELDYFVKAFEVKKLLFDEYIEGKITPVDQAQYADIANYEMLAYSAIGAYDCTANLKYLNVLLKVNDTLLSVVDGMSREERIKLAWLLKKECTIVKKEELSIGRKGA